MSDDIKKLVYEAYKEVLDLQDASFEKPKKIDEDTPIYGSDGYLDSLGLVRLVVAVEERLRDKFNVSISVVSDKAVSQSRSPFKDVKSLARYLKSLLKEELNEEKGDTHNRL